MFSPSGKDAYRVFQTEKLEKPITEMIKIAP